MGRNGERRGDAEAARGSLEDEGRRVVEGADGEHRRRGVAPADGDRCSLGKTEGGGGLRGDGAAALPRGGERRRNLRRESHSSEHAGRRLRRQHVAEAFARPGVGERRARQPKPDVILGLEDEARARDRLRLVSRQPEELGRGIGGGPGQPRAEERLGIAELVFERSRLVVGPVILPRERGPHGLALRVDRDQGRGLPGEPDPVERHVVRTTGGDRLSRRAEIVVRLLLGDAAGGVGRRIGRGGAAGDRAVAAHEQRLHRGGAEVESEPRVAAHGARWYPLNPVDRMNSVEIDAPFEIAAGTFCVATDYPEVADAPLWVYVLRDASSGGCALIDCGVPSTYERVFERVFPMLGVDVADLRWIVLTRGHTRGHCALFERESGLLFSGDVVQVYGISTSSGKSVYAPLYDDVDDYVHGLERLRALPFTKLCPAHFLPLDREEGLERIERSVAFTEEMDRLVADLLAGADGPMTTADVATAVGEFCGTEPPVSIQTVYAATAHLKRAARNGIVHPRWVPAARS